MKIGITCYPSVGGSGILASALGGELAQRGHEIHFISYERPFRLPLKSPRICFPPVGVNDYGLFKYPDTRCRCRFAWRKSAGTISSMFCTFIMLCRTPPLPCSPAR